MKVCSTCKVEKEVSEFNKNNSKKDGLQTLCKDCNRKRSRRYYDENREHHLKIIGGRNKAIRNKNRKFILEYFSDKACIDCGNSDLRVFEFDHVRGVKISDVGKLINNSNSIDRLVDEISKCDIVCANCHRIRTFSRIDTYRNAA